MLKDYKISTYQFTVLVILCFLGTSVLVTPRGLALDAKQDAWLSALLGIIISFLIVMLYNALGSIYPNMTIIECLEIALGKWLGKIISISFIIFSFLNASMLLWFVGNFITTQMMPETPIQITNALLVIVVVMGTRLGLEPFARAGEILLPYVMGFLAILTLFIAKDIKIKNMFPVFEYGIKPILHGTLTFISYSSLTLVIMLMIYPAYINCHKDTKKGFLGGTLISGIIIFILTNLCILVIGHDLTARNMFPVYILAKKISLGNAVERVEVIIAISWFITIFYKITLYFYGATLGLAQTLRLNDYRPLTLPLGLLLLFFSLIVYPSTSYADTWNGSIWIPFSLTYGFFIPVLLLIIGKIRNSSNTNINK